MSTSPIDLVIAIPTFVGSVLSFLATSVAIVLHIVIPPKRHFRHALIINLLVADFMNSLNNTISGAIALVSKHTNKNTMVGASCLANAWLGQFSVQAIDFNILIISIVVLFTVFNSRLVAQSSAMATTAVCAAAWIPGIITSTIGLYLGAYGYVSGNWCWIRPEYLGLRYGLTHGWRIAIFLATIAIYTYIYIHLKRRFGKFRISHPSSATLGDPTCFDDGAELSDTQHILVSNSYEVSDHLDDRPKQIQAPLDPALIGKATLWSASAEDCRSQTQSTRPFQSVQKSADPIQPASHIPAPPNLKKMLLMNGYPIAYILLWIPGMANRLAESTNASPSWLQALQCSTQFIGFVNAFTYGFSEHLRQASLQWKSRRRFLRARD